MWPTILMFIPVKQRTCMVTGANTGVGKETALGLAQMGATVLMVCRDQRRGEAARQEIVTLTGNERVDLMIADLSSQSSIRELAADFQTRYASLHVLVNNAGMGTSRRTLTDEGIETTFAVNHLGYFLLTNLLLDTLKASAPARIVNVASEAHKRVRLNLADLQGENGFNGWQAYCQSKLANILFTYELARSLNGSGVTVNCLHPGVVATNLIRRHFKQIWLRPFYYLVRPFLTAPEKGAQTSLYLASAAELDGVTGKYFINKREAASSPETYDDEIAKGLWRISLDLTSL